MATHTNTLLQRKNPDWKPNEDGAAFMSQLKESGMEMHCTYSLYVVWKYIVHTVYKLYRALYSVHFSGMCNSDE